MTQDSVTTNYNAAGTIVMERIYGANYLSPGGAAATAALATLGEIGQGLRVLDAGSGIGGAAFYLASQHQCQVQGIDLMPDNVAIAAQRAQAQNLAGQVNFECGDATTLNFPDSHFDLIWGQDAWCHITDKARLLTEFARVVVPGGKLVFSDWLTSEPQSKANEAARQVTASPNMADAETYKALLTAAGFNIHSFQDRSTEFTQNYRAIVDRLLALESELREQFSQKLFDVVSSKQRQVLAAFEDRTLAAASIVAVRN